MDGRANVSARTKAAWLLKDLCDPGVAPNLERVACFETCPAQLREQILDTLERTSFGVPEVRLDLDRLSGVSHGPAGRRAFFGILLNIGTSNGRSWTRYPNRRSVISGTRDVADYQRMLGNARRPLMT
jgi:hypothetical protein